MTGLPCPAEHWDAFSKLLDQAFGLPAPERAHWLDTLPGEHAHLRPWLSRVLDADAGLRAGDFLTHPRLPPLPDSDAAFEPGQPIGPYRLDTLLGRGGMGEVWRARRIDGALDRTVALKLPRSELITPGIRQRLQRERDILASLTHPHIAQLYDAGITAQGQPYLALELIEGEPIDVHSNARRLRIEARIALFAQVLDAVRFAHGRLVVHRDLKPTNILVTPEGQVKLLDFDIAKLLDEQGGGDSTELTRLAGRAMTPEYAAPEQLAGEAVSVATDVFSLGIVLFELLTGQRPFAKARTEDAPLASTRVVEDHATACGLADARALRKRLDGDLDAILARSLAHDVPQRYASVEQLADDLVRALAHQPIRARHITRVERVAKFVRRHRVPVALGAALATALVVGVTGVAWQARRADAAAAAAQARAQELQRVVDFQAGQLARMDVEQFGLQFLEQMRARIASSAGDAAARQALLDAFDRIRALAQPADVARTTLGRYLLEPARSEIDERFEAEPRTRALLIGGIARSYSDLGLFENALAEVQRFDEAGRQVFGEESAEVARMRLLQASILVNVGRARDAIPIARQAVEGLTRTLGPAQLDTLQARRTLALALTFSEDPASIQEAADLFASIEAPLRAALGANDGQYLEARRVQAYALRLLEQPQHAAEILSGVAAIERKDPQRYRKQLPKVLANLCEVQSLAGAVDAALAICAE
ncbi:MAG TPA: serine/threonine-protein kinase, partial [Nevskiaceae bacterium]|nr:serine/threonine-protein kinase [Nevskiaceae bacterium]